MGVVQILPLALLAGYGFLRLSRALKKRGGLDVPLYFGLPFAAVCWSAKTATSCVMFEIGFPAHPTVIEQRRRVINECCFYAPGMIKNEVEYMHGKLAGVKTEDDLADKLQEEEGPSTMKYEKEFTTGELGLSLLTKKGKDQRLGKKFKIIVDHGELYLECIDPFEEVFEVNKDLIKDLELTDILDPYLFDNHRDIVNALFEVYYDIGEAYLQEFYDEKQVNKIKNEARDRVEKQYGIGKYDDKEPTSAADVAK